MPLLPHLERLVAGHNLSAEEAQNAMQTILDGNAPAAQIKDALDKYEASQKAKLATLATDQEALRSVLTAKQEAAATLLGLVP